MKTFGDILKRGSGQERTALGWETRFAPELGYNKRCGQLMKSRAQMESTIYVRRKLLGTRLKFLEWSVKADICPNGAVASAGEADRDSYQMRSGNISLAVT